MEIKTETKIDPLVSIEYISEDDNQEVIIEKNNSIISPISLNILGTVDMLNQVNDLTHILESILDKRVNIIFSQGSLNLTPIVSCIFAIQKQQDIIIGIPKQSFKDSFEESENTYFSLLYRKKIGSTYSDSLYFYTKMVWCKGFVDENTDQLKVLIVSTRPKHGKRRYINDFDAYAKNMLINGTFQQFPKIVSIPVDSNLPIDIIGKKPISFKEEKFKSTNFDPKLIIYESINERNYSLNSIIELIDKTEKMGIKLILHFSWPYINGLSRFLEKIGNNNDIAVLHLGKRFCIELRNYFRKPPHNIINLSLEGRAWDIYYPSHHHLNIRTILPVSNINNENCNVKDIEHWDWSFDQHIKEIREYIEYERLNKFDENILRFPPVIDTFLSPSKIKRVTFLEKEKSYRHISINESVSIMAGDNSRAARKFSNLCYDLERGRDISYELMGNLTSSVVTKKTLLQAFLIEKIAEATNQNDMHDTYIIIANLFPYLIRQSPLFESIDYLIKSVTDIITSLKLPYISKENNILYIEKDLYNGEKLKEIIMIDNSILETNIRNIKRLFSYTNQNVDIYIIKKDNHDFEISIEINVPIEYLELGQRDYTISKKYFKKLVLYKTIIRNDGSFEEHKILNISFEWKLQNSVIKIKKIYTYYKNGQFNEKPVEHGIKIMHMGLSKMRSVRQELIRSSELLIPGPIPYVTVSDDGILMPPHGYDAIQLPFKNIVFFAYPGANFKNLLRQIKLYNDLLSENQTSVSRKDLQFSIDTTRNIQRFNLPFIYNLYDVQETVCMDDKKYIDSEEDTPMDTIFKQEYLNDTNIDEGERKTIKDIWDHIHKNLPGCVTNTSFRPGLSKENIDFCVEFDTGVRETKQFPIGMLIRKRIDNLYTLYLVEDLSEGDIIIYIQTDELEGIENYVLRTIFSDEKLSLEEIFEPLTALKIFYASLRSLDLTRDYDKNTKDKMRKLYWLSDAQKENLFYLIRILLCEYPMQYVLDSWKFDHLSDTSMNDEQDLQKLILYLQRLLDDSIWKGLISPEDIFDIFMNGNPSLTYEKLYDLFSEFGSKNYAISSFIQICMQTIVEQKHYHFMDENNLLAIGRLIGHDDIIENYQIINRKGRHIHTILMRIGQSIQRVANGRSDPLNDIDNIVEQKMKICKIIKKGRC